LETFLELLLLCSFQCRRHFSVFWNLHPFKADFTFGNRSYSEPNQRNMVGVSFQ
jgi:hypothetical protein